MDYGGNSRRLARERVTAIVTDVHVKESYARLHITGQGYINASFDIGHGPIYNVPAKGESWELVFRDNDWRFDRQSIQANTGRLQAQKDNEEGNSYYHARNEIEIKDKHGTFPNRKDFEALSRGEGGSYDLEAPTGLSHTVRTFLSESGYPASEIELSWDRVAGNDIRYEIYERQGNQPESLFATTTSNRFKMTHVIPGTQVRYRLRTLGFRGITSSFSQSITFTVPEVQVPLYAPQDPTLRSSTLYLEVLWGGLDRYGNPMPSSVTHCEISISQQQNSRSIMGNVSANTTWTTSDLMPGEQYYVAIRAVTNRGQRGPWSNTILFRFHARPQDGMIGEIDDRINEIIDEIYENRFNPSEMQKVAARAQEAADEALERAENALESKPNRQRNGGFEEFWAGWTPPYGEGAVISEMIARSGVRSAQFMTDTEILGQEVDVQVNDVIQISGWYRSEVGEQRPIVGGLRLQYRNAEGQWFNMAEPQMSVTNGEWENFLIREVMPFEAVRVRARVASGFNTAQFHLDDITVKDVTDVFALEQAAAAIMSYVRKIQADLAYEHAAEAIQSASTKNTIFTSPLAPTSEGKSIGDVWWQIDDDGRVTKQWQWDGQNWIRQQIENEMIANLDVGKLVASTANITEAVIEKLWAEVITARKITATMIAVADWTNLATIDETIPVLPQAQWQGTELTPDGYVTAGSISSNFLAFRDFEGPVHLKPRDELIITFKARANAPFTRWVRAQFQSKEGTNFYVNSQNFSVGTGETSVSVVMTIPDFPSGVERIDRFLIYVNGVENTNFRVKEVFVRKRSGGEMIVDGPITAKTFQSHAAPFRGVKFDPDGIHGWNNTGKKTFEVTSAGRVTMVDARVEGSIHAGTGNNAQVHIDYGRKTMIRQDEEEPSGVVRTFHDTAYIDFRTQHSHVLSPTIFIHQNTGEMVIGPGYLQNTPAYRATVVVLGDLKSNRLRARIHETNPNNTSGYFRVHTNSSAQMGGLGVSSTDEGRTRLQGRSSSMRYTQDYIASGRSGPFTAAPGHRWSSTQTWYAPSPTGDIWPHVSYHMGEVSADNYGNIAGATSHLTSSGFQWNASNIQGNGTVTFYVHYVGIWR